MNIFKIGDTYTWPEGHTPLIFEGRKITVMGFDKKGRYIVEIEGRPFNRFGGYAISEDDLIGNPNNTSNPADTHRLTLIARVAAAADRIRAHEDSAVHALAQGQKEQADTEGALARAAMFDLWQAWKGLIDITPDWEGRLK